MKKMIELTLPPFAMLRGYGDENELQGREVILHVRSASVIEVFMKGNAFLSEDVITYSFTMSVPRITNPSEMATATFVLALHHSPLLDVVADRYMIIEEIMKPTAKYYHDYQMYLYERAKTKHTAMLDIMHDYDMSYEDEEDDDDYYYDDLDDMP